MRAACISALVIAVAVDTSACALIDAVSGGDSDARDPEGYIDAQENLPDDGGGGGDGGGSADGGLQVEFESAQLWAIHPPIAQAGAVVRMEGEFTTTDENRVYFSELASEFPVTPLGVGRATFQVSSSVTHYAGDVRVSAESTSSHWAWLRLTPFRLGLTRIQDHYPQTNGARTMPVLDVARMGHTSHVVDGWVYAIGGVSDHTIARAEINADGSVTPFSLHVNAMQQARHGHTSVRLGPWLYVLGGEYSGGALGSVERANIESSARSVGAFSGYQHALVVPRSGAAVAVLGSFVYVIGGGWGSDLASIERAEIDKDGNLGPFELLTHTALVTPRLLHSVHVIGDHLYAIGGRATSGDALAGVERAPISPNGDLGNFVPVQTLLQKRAGHVSVVLGDRIYVLGGAADAPLDSVESATIDTGGDVGMFGPAGFALPEARADATGVTVGNDLYLIGGHRDGSATTSVARGPVILEGGLSSTVSMQSGFLSQLRRGHAVAAASDWLFTFGGVASGADHIGRVASLANGVLNLPFVQLGQWDNARSGGCTAVLGERIFFVGGANQAGTAQTMVEQTGFSSMLATPLDPSTRALDTPRAETACVALGGYLYVIGGEDSAVLDTVERAPFDAAGNLTGDFVPVGGVTLQTARKGHTVAVLGDYLYVIGGVGSGGGDLASIERAAISPDGIVGAFSAYGSLPEPRNGHATMAIGPKLYVFGSDSRYDFQAATIDADGSFSSFADAAPAFAHYRHRSASIVVGNFLYVLGGEKDTDISGEVLRIFLEDE